ncbi:hypothetical protein PHMEG_00013025 [Phytophthora megakarya]|uniref:Uncharacterized protein n=1 Tax=Phytophthora megakarya TaxID=4795 RepID=A0A225W8Y1_9STRA|nr:hypothetical protein PHMEG_00013025 [Phytophthora megakarya]
MISDEVSSRSKNAKSKSAHGKHSNSQDIQSTISPASIRTSSRKRFPLNYLWPGMFATKLISHRERTTVLPGNDFWRAIKLRLSTSSWRVAVRRATFVRLNDVTIPAQTPIPRKNIVLDSMAA